MSTIARVQSFAFQGIETVPVEVQVQIAPGLPAFLVVGLPDKAVAESRERVRAALVALGLSLPPKRVLINLAPADLLKEGSHFDLPIALAVLAAMEVLGREEVAQYAALGELGLDGTLAPVAGVLPAAIGASARELGLICPEAQGAEAAWAGAIEVLAAPSLLAIVNHFKGTQVLTPPTPPAPGAPAHGPDMSEVKGQESAKRAVEIAAAGGHNLLLIGPPGAGKSMLAARLPSILPPMSPEEMLEVSMVHSLAGELMGGKLAVERPFRAPHHSASMAALVGGGSRPRPGEVSLAHLGVLFLDELPEFSPQVLDSLRQPLETGETVIARANHRIAYPSRIQLVAAMNPCRCGGGRPGEPCKRGPRCAAEYQARISGPLIDRIDLQIEVPAVSAADLVLPAPAEGSAEVKARVTAARERQRQRLAALGAKGIRTNAECSGQLLEQIAMPDAEGVALLRHAADALGLTARGFHRTLKVARTLADLDGADTVGRIHVAEALSYRGETMRQRQAA